MMKEVDLFIATSKVDEFQCFGYEENEAGKRQPFWSTSRRLCKHSVWTPNAKGRGIGKTKCKWFPMVLAKKHKAMLDFHCAFGFLCYKHIKETRELGVEG